MKQLIDIINEKLILSKQKNKYPEEEYFYHEALKDGYTTKFINTENVLQYSIDNCQTWNDLEPDTATPEIKAGERIYFKGENLKATAYDGIGRFESNKLFNAAGNIMSLIYGDNFDGQTKLLKLWQFKSLFHRNYYLVSAEDLVLPATKLTEECYCMMFYYCEALNDAPVLPATKLTEECYYMMFCKCYPLKEITMLATDISAYDCLNCWVDDIYDTGTFTKAKGVDIPTGKDGIPEGWTVKEI